MGKEQSQPSASFEFTEHEKLYDRISDTRLKALLADNHTTIHTIELSTNNYGEFVFLTISREMDGQRTVVTFWGLGFHEYRERWITDHWSWYTSHSTTDAIKQRLPVKQAETILRQRQEEIASYVSKDTQTQRGQLFELLADLTDDDGAWVELEDLGEAADWLIGADAAGEPDERDKLPQTRPMFDEDTE